MMNKKLGIKISSGHPWFFNADESQPPADKISFQTLPLGTRSMLHAYIWANYSDLSRRLVTDLSRGHHPKWWFSKGIPPKMADKNQVKDL